MVFIRANREWKHGHEENAKALNVQTPFDISELIEHSRLCALHPGDQGETGEEGDQGKLGKNGRPGLPGDYRHRT